jgi:hypothetical protein
VKPRDFHLPSPLRPPTQSVEQLRYARALDWGTRAGLVLLVVSFVAYVSGAIAPLVPLDELPALWHLPAERFRAITGAPTGWQWLALLDRGDLATFVGIAVLAGCSMACLVALLPLYLARRDRTYFALCVAELGVLGLAASGLLTTGH